MTRLIATFALIAALMGLGWWVWKRGALGFLPTKLDTLLRKGAEASPDVATTGEGAARTTPAEDPAFASLKEAADAAGSGDLVKARELLRELLANPSAAPHLPVVKALLGEVNLTLLLNPGEGPGKTPYVVQSGDAIARIASRTGASAELIVRSNNLMGLTIRKGDTLYIPTIDAAVVIYLRHSALQIFDGEEFFKEYPIRKFRLPPGARFPLETVISEKISTKDGARVAFGDPAFFDATRTITLKSPGFNIHATGNGEKPGVVPSNTGFLLDPADLDEIFLLVKRGTPVQIFAE